MRLALALVLCLSSFVFAQGPGQAAAPNGGCGPGGTCRAARFISTAIPTASSELGQVCQRNPNGVPWMFDTSTNSVWALKYDGASNQCPRPGFTATAFSYNLSSAAFQTSQFLASQAGSTGAFCSFLNLQAGFSFGTYHSTSTWTLGGWANGGCTGGAPSTNYGRLQWSLNTNEITSVGPFNASTKMTLTPTAATTAFATAAAGNVQNDVNTGHLYYYRGTVPNTTPPFDLGGEMHPVLQRKTYLIEVGHGGSAAPFFDIAPKTNAGFVTITEVQGTVTGNSLSSGNNAPYGPPYHALTTTAVLNNTASVTTSANWIEARRSSFRVCQRVYLGSQTNVRDWIGVGDNMPGSSDAPATWNFLGFRFSTSAGDTNLMYCNAAGGGTTCTSTGVAPNNGTVGIGSNLLCIDARETSAVTFWVDGVARARITSGIPADGIRLRPVLSVEALAAALTAIQTSRIAIEVN